MSSDSSWKTFFAAHAAIYDNNVFTKNTLREVDFLLEELHVPPGARILDVGCGTGRHSIELAKRGYRMTGLDLSRRPCSHRRRTKAEAAGVHVDWVQSDAMRFSFDEPFDAAICLCEGSFGLLASVDDAIAQPLAILSNISRSLKPGARILLTALNGMWMIRMHKQEDVEQGGFDPLTLAQTSDVVPVEGQPPRPRHGAGVRADGTGPAVPAGRADGPEHLGRDGRQLGTQEDRPRRDRDHGGGPQIRRTAYRWQPTSF